MLPRPGGRVLGAKSYLCLDMSGAHIQIHQAIHVSSVYSTKHMRRFTSGEGSNAHVHLHPALASENYNNLPWAEETLDTGEFLTLG